MRTSRNINAAPQWWIDEYVTPETEPILEEEIIESEIQISDPIKSDETIILKPTESETIIEDIIPEEKILGINQQTFYIISGVSLVALYFLLKK